MRWERAGWVVVEGAVAVGLGVSIHHVALVIRLAAYISHANRRHPIDLLLHRGVPGLGHGRLEAPGEGILLIDRAGNRRVDRRFVVRVGPWDLACAGAEWVAVRRAERRGCPWVVEVHVSGQRLAGVRCAVTNYAASGANRRIRRRTRGECRSKGRHIDDVVVVGVRHRSTEHAECGVEGGARHVFGLIGNADAGLKEHHAAGAKPGSHIGVAGVNQSRWRGGEHFALLAGHESRPTATDRSRRNVRIPAQAKGKGQAGLQAELVVDVRVDQPSLDVGQFACSLLEVAHVTHEPVCHAIAGVAAAEVDDGVGRIVGGVFDRPLMHQIDARRDGVTVDGLDQSVGEADGATDFIRGLRPAAVGGAEICALHIAARLGDADVARPAHVLAVMVEDRGAVMRALLGPETRERVHRGGVHRPGVLRNLVEVPHLFAERLAPVDHVDHGEDIARRVAGRLHKFVDERAQREALALGQVVVNLGRVLVELGISQAGRCVQHPPGQILGRGGRRRSP